MKKKLLFVTYFDKHPDEGLSYVIQLAKVMHEDLTVFLLREKNLTRKIDDLMTAITFAEADDAESARQAITEGSQPRDKNSEKKLAGFFYKCRKSGIKIELISSRTDVVSAIEEYFKHRNGIDIVLLGPNIAEHTSISQRRLKKLSGIVARPIVTIAKQMDSESI